MIAPQTLAVVLALASAVAWGAGDFSGGIATRKGNLYSVVLLSQIIGSIFLIGLALLFGEQMPASAELLFAALAGVAGMIGLLALYSGLATGRMSIVAPFTAVISATIPIIFALFSEGRPPFLQIAGFILALVAVWLLSGGGSGENIQRTEAAFSLLAGSGFALFFIFIDQANETAVFWPLTVARLVSIGGLALYIARRGLWQAPQRSHLPLIALVGLLDALGNTFFTFAARLGRLDLAAVLSSLYPATTVFLAWRFLHEKLSVNQWFGVLLALLALIMITN